MSLKVGIRDPSSLVFPALSLWFAILGEIFVYRDFSYSSHRGSDNPSSWMTHAGCVFCTDCIHPSRT